VIRDKRSFLTGNGLLLQEMMQAKIQELEEKMERTLEDQRVRMQAELV
jgi:hypothetical protein